MGGCDNAFVKVTWKGMDVSAGAVVVELEDDDRLADRVRVRFNDRVATVGMAPGDPIQVDMGWATEHALLFDGYVSELRSQRDASGTGTFLTGLDRSWPMNAQRKTRELPPGKLSTIVQSVVSSYGLPVGKIVCDPDPVFTASAPLQQTTQSDLVLLQELAARYHARAFVEINDDTAAFYWAPESNLMAAAAALTLTWRGGQGELHAFRHSQDTWHGAATLNASTQDPTTGAAVTTPAVPPPAPITVTASTDALDTLNTGARDRTDDYRAVVQNAAMPSIDPAQITPTGSTPGLASEPDRGPLLVQGDLTSAQGLRAEGAVTGSVHLRAKSRVSVAKLEDTRLNGDWYLRRVRHTYRSDGHGARGQYETTFSATR
jgi:phage protein D